MNSSIIRRLVILNTIIVIINISLFSNALLGLSLLSGSVLSVSISWAAVLASVFAFLKGNSLILNKTESRLLMQNINSLDNCVYALKVAMHNGDVFDENISKNIEQIYRFRRKQNTINDLLLQKFSAEELSFQKFYGVLTNVENVIYINMRSILYKISAFDIDEYEAIQRNINSGIKQTVSQEKMDIYKQYIDFVNDATQINEDILLKLDKMLLEISRYNFMEDGDVLKLPAIKEMDELINNARLYK